MVVIVGVICFIIGAASGIFCMALVSVNKGIDKSIKYTKVGTYNEEKTV